jgi:hypothetical protein
MHSRRKSFALEKKEVAAHFGAPMWSGPSRNHASDKRLTRIAPNFKSLPLLNSRTAPRRFVRTQLEMGISVVNGRRCAGPAAILRFCLCPNATPANALEISSWGLPRRPALDTTSGQRRRRNVADGRSALGTPQTYSVTAKRLTALSFVRVLLDSSEQPSYVIASTSDV